MTIDSGILAMPLELRKYVLQNFVSKSPYNQYGSGSYYSKVGKSWDFTPENCERVSDHWNFYSQGQYHCKIKSIVDNLSLSDIVNKWCVGIYDTISGQWDIIKVYAKDKTALLLSEKRRVLKQSIKDILVVIKEKVQKFFAKKLKAIEKRRYLEVAKKRETKIKKGNVYAIVNVNIWKGTGRRITFGGTETIIGRIVWESKTGGSFIIERPNGNRKEIRKYTTYKELPRKPKEFIKKLG